MSARPRVAGRVPGCLLRPLGAAGAVIIAVLLLTQVAFGALLLRLGPFASPTPGPRHSARAAAAP